MMLCLCDITANKYPSKVIPLKYIIDSSIPCITISPITKYRPPSPSQYVFFVIKLEVLDVFYVVKKKLIKTKNILIMSASRCLVRRYSTHFDKVFQAHLDVR